MSGVGGPFVGTRNAAAGSGRPAEAAGGEAAGDAATAGPNDLVVAVAADDETVAEGAISAAELLLASQPDAASAASASDAPPPRTIAEAVTELPAANLAIISTPGPYATAEASTLAATARKLLLDPVEIGPVRLLGVGFSGLSDVRQESLFPDLDQGQPQEITVGEAARVPVASPDIGGWRIGDDVRHTEWGHGWIQGAGHGVMTIRFETRAGGPGIARTFPVDTADITRANPVDSLDWPDFVDDLESSAEPGDDLGGR